MNGLDLLMNNEKNNYFSYGRIIPLQKRNLDFLGRTYEKNFEFSLN